MVIVGGLAAGAAFAAVTGVAAAATGGSAATAPSGKASAPAAPPAHPDAPGGPIGGPGPSGMPGPPGGMGLGGPGGPGGEGTITAINGSTLTLRTMNGSETVDTSSSTTYSKERLSIDFADLSIGDVVAVSGSPARSGTSSAPPPPGTGTVDASRITVVEPTFVGRVVSDSGGVLTLVGPDGQLLSVHTSSSTRYYQGTQSTTSSAVSDGTHILAEGTQTGLTSLDADVVAVAPPPPAPGQAPAPPHPPSAPPASSSDPTPPNAGE